MYSVWMVPLSDLEPHTDQCCLYYMCHSVHNYFHFSQPTGCARTCVCASVLGCLFGAMFVLDVSFLSWSSFKFDTVQVANG